MTELCELAKKYSSDKCPEIKHNYTPLYYDMLKDKRESIKKVVEVGVGCLETMSHCKNYQVGASLRMWRDFFPNAMIYGIDIRPDAQLQDDRIKTFQANEKDEEEMMEIMREIGYEDIDLFIDDGEHHSETQGILGNMMMPILKKDVIYIVEDVCRPRSLGTALINYNLNVIDVGGKWHHEKLVIVNRK